MKLAGATFQNCQPSRRGSVLIIVLWVAFGLVSIALYFANSMSLELRAADNRVAATEADQAIAGATRYLTNIFLNLTTVGYPPDTNTYQFASVPVGDAAFWFIGRGDSQATTPDQPVFSLVAESSKLNLNTATLSNLSLLPRMTPELAAAIIDWRDSDTTVTQGGAEDETYARLKPAYKCKNGPFESIDELRLVYGMDLDILYGEDVNLNGVLDSNENDGDASAPSDNRDGRLDPGILEYVTVFSREPNTKTNGSARVNVRTLSATQLNSLLQPYFEAQRIAQIAARLGLAGGGGGGGGGGRGGGGGGPGGGGTPTSTSVSPLAFFIRSGMTVDEFALVANDITVATGSYVTGRVNVVTASATVLACLPGQDANSAAQLISYRQSNPDKLTSIAWVVEALSDNTPALQALQSGDFITAQSYQFTADVAALGHNGRGFKRIKFVYDLAEGTPAIRYRQDLTHLGWALGKQVRDVTRTAKATP